MEDIETRRLAREQEASEKQRQLAREKMEAARVTTNYQLDHIAFTLPQYIFFFPVYELTDKQKHEFTQVYKDYWEGAGLKRYVSF